MELWVIEGQASVGVRGRGYSTQGDFKDAVVQASHNIVGYNDKRRIVARGVMRAERIASQLGIPYVYKSCPPPVIGGPVISIPLFSAILTDNSYGGINPQMIADALEKVSGEVDAEFHRYLWRALNPITLVFDLLAYILRLPFLFLAAAGFNTDKIEDQLWGRLFKVAELFVMAWLALNYFGLDKSVVEKLFTRGQ